LPFDQSGAPAGDRQITLIAAGAAILLSFAAVLVDRARAARRHQTAPQRMTARHSARRAVHHLQLRRHPLPGREPQQFLQRVGGPAFAAGRRAGQSQALDPLRMETANSWAAMPVPVLEPAE